MNLYRHCVSDKTIQAILRHSNLSITMNVYVKSMDADSVAAMKRLEAMLSNMTPTSSDENTGLIARHDS